jgi:hypothetical protein
MLQIDHDTKDFLYQDVTEFQREGRLLQRSCPGVNAQGGNRWRYIHIRQLPPQCHQAVQVGLRRPSDISQTIETWTFHDTSGIILWKVYTHQQRATFLHFAWHWIVIGDAQHAFHA